MGADGVWIGRKSQPTKTVSHRGDLRFPSRGNNDCEPRNRRGLRCCFPLQPQVNPRALVVFFTEAFHVAPPRPKRARVHVKRNVRPRRPPRQLRRLAHEAVRPSFRFSRAAKDRDKARFHCWRFFVTGGAPLDPRGVHVRPPPTHRARRIITDAPQ